MSLKTSNRNFTLESCRYKVGSGKSELRLGSFLQSSKPIDELGERLATNK